MPVNVLLVDDHPMLMLVMKRFLARMDSLILVGEAESGQEALRMVEELQPDVMVLDIRLPDMSGFEVAHEVARRFPNVKIIMVSAQLDPATARKALASGARGVIPKDQFFEELSPAIDKLNDSPFYISESIES
jgi:DNA-binding NarL/FixJ family response regulator